MSIEASRRGAARYLTAAAVLAAHAALIAALMVTWRPGTLAASTANSVQLLLIAPVDPPKVRVMANLRRRGGGMAITVAPPLLDSALFPIAVASGSGTKGEGPGVDWAAEARRALQAFEIRNQQPAANKSVSGGPEEDHWRPGAQHHAGDRYKTANGDWIVWVNADCYEIASAGSSAYAHVAPLTQSICRDQSATAAQ